MPDLSVLLTHGPLFFWAALALAALLGPLRTWLVTRSRARARAAAALGDMGHPDGRLEPREEGEVSILSGVLELEGTTELVQDSLRDPPAGAQGTSIETAYLRVGDTRVALDGLLRLRAGSREGWGRSIPAVAASQRDPRPGPRRLRVRAGDRVRARGIPRVLPVAGEQSYREARSRHVLGPEVEGGRVELCAEDRPRVCVGPGRLAWSLVLAAALFTALAWCGGWAAGHLAWDAAIEADGDVARARWAVRWGQLAATTPFHRRWALNAIDAALSPTDIADPHRQREFLLLAASHERFRTGSCTGVLGTVRRSARRAAAELGETCGDAASLRVAAEERLALGEIERAADLVARAGRLERERSIDQLSLEKSAYLLAGRLEQAAAAIREIQPRVDEFYHPLDPDQDVGAWREGFRVVLGCAADQLSARAGDGAARARMEADMVGATSRPHARAVCGLMLADLAVGAQRLALIDRIRGDEGIERLAELELLEIEADPARASGYSGLSHITLPAWVLAGEWSTHRLGALEWSALERLAGAVDPPLPVRRRRARLAAELAPVASLLGDDATALRWLDLVDRDWRVLRADMEGSSTVEGMLWEQLDMLAIQRAYIELRAGRVPARPRPQAAGEQSMAPGLAGEWRELEGVLDFASRGALDLLRQGSEMATFARDLRWENKAFEGVEVAARGSGDELARWLAEKDSFAIRVALLGATRIQSGREAMRSWLRGAAVDTMSRSLAETAAGAASRQKIAQALGDDAAAAEHGACAARLRRALLRRDTALVRRILRVE